MKNKNSIESQKNIQPVNSITIRLIAIFWFIGILLGALQAWDNRFAMNSDGISYLDIADAYFRGDWQNAINAYWGPLYSWILGFALFILKPSPYYEFPVVHIVNFLLYLWALGCFHFLIVQLINYQQHNIKTIADNGISFPEWAWIALGYTLFIRSSINMITVSSVTPDMLLSGFVYLAFGIILRIRQGLINYSTYILLGVVLGFGYLTKAVMFPLTFIFLLISIFSAGNIKKGIQQSMFILFFFFIIAGPFIFLISNSKGRFTFGESGRYNYWFHVNRHETFHWDGAPPDSGTPLHPPRRILDKPAVYEFATPIGGTYPLWYDPSYWNDGIKIHFDFKRQLETIKMNITSYYHTYYPRYSALIFSILLLYLMSDRGRWILKDILEQWHLLLPVIAVFGIYSLVWVDDRYTGPFNPILWLALFSGIRLPDSKESKKLLKYLTIIMVSVLMVMTVRDMIKNRRPWPDVQWQVVSALKDFGISQGDKIAGIGYSHNQTWARLARVRFIAEVTHKDIDDFWNADNLVKSKVYETFRKIGAKAIITNKGPNGTPPPGWQKIANTDYYIYVLSK